MSGEPILLDTTLRPSPPMDSRVLLGILIGVAVSNIAIALNFILRGAWPILPFIGLDVALLAWAFRASKRAALRSEHIIVTPSRLDVEQRAPDGAITHAAFNPYWVRVDLQRVTEFSHKLFLRSHGRAVQVGSFLAPALREGFAEALKAALSKAKSTRF